MKKLLLTGIAVLFLATGTARAEIDEIKSAIVAVLKADHPMTVRQVEELLPKADAPKVVQIPHKPDAA